MTEMSLSERIERLTHPSGNDPGICGNLLPLSPAAVAARTGGSGSFNNGSAGGK